MRNSDHARMGTGSECSSWCTHTARYLLHSAIAYPIM